MYSQSRHCAAEVEWVTTTPVSDVEVPVPVEEAVELAAVSAVASCVCCVPVSAVAPAAEVPEEAAAASDEPEEAVVLAASVLSEEPLLAAVLPCMRLLPTLYPVSGSM